MLDDAPTYGKTDKRNKMAMTDPSMDILFRTLQMAEQKLKEVMPENDRLVKENASLTADFKALSSDYSDLVEKHATTYQMALDLLGREQGRLARAK